MSETPLDVNTPAVQKHLELLQDVINRMASESRALKTWCVTIVAAILFVVARTDASWCVTLLALLPVIAFWVLDAYYLALERVYRDKYDAFVGKLHGGQLSLKDLYVVTPGKEPLQWWEAIKSKPVWVFYLAVVVSIAVATWLLAEYAHMDAPLQVCQTECVSSPER